MLKAITRQRRWLAFAFAVLAAVVAAFAGYRYLGYQRQLEPWCETFAAELPRFADRNAARLMADYKVGYSVDPDDCEVGAAGASRGTEG